MPSKSEKIAKAPATTIPPQCVSFCGGGATDWRYAFFVTRQGIAKRVAFEELKYNNRAKRIIKLDEGDEIAQVRLTTGNDDLMLITRRGQALRVNENEFRSMGRNARGVIAITLKDDDKVISCDVVNDKQKMLVISKFGIGKRVEFSEFMPHHRNTAGIRIIELNERTGRLSASLAVRDSDEIMVISSKGRIIRMPVNDISVMKRHSVGTIIVRLDEGDSVAYCSLNRTGSGDEEDSATISFEAELED